VRNEKKIIINQRVLFESECCTLRSHHSVIPSCHAIRVLNSLLVQHEPLTFISADDQ